MNKEIILKYEKAYNSAENYNTLIWTVFSVGIALSLYILNGAWANKLNMRTIDFVRLVLGFLVLFYCILTIESFGQKKSLMYKIFDENIKGFYLKEKIKKLPFYRVEWIAEIILLFILFSYIFIFFFISIKKSLTIPLIPENLVAWIFFILSLILLFIITINWISRPKDDDGNQIEKTRVFLFGNWLRSYDEIIGLKTS